jgi:hypothetical protein
MDGQSMSHSKASTEKNLEIVYNNLSKLYDLTVDRRKTLSGQAAGLLGFTGIIQTVFLGLLITLATSTEAREIILAGQNHATIVYLLATGFVTFIITISLALAAYFEPKWVGAPVVLQTNDDMEWKRQLEELKMNPGSVPVMVYEMQLQNGIRYNNKINNCKYWVLFVAYLFLAVSLFLMAIVGFYIIAGMA